MAQTHKRLATSRPVLATQTTAYTAPPATKAMISSIFVCNTSSVDETLRLHVVPSGGAAGVGNAIYYDVTVRGNDTLLINAVPVLETGDFISVYALLGTLTFTISGMEIA